MKKSEPLKYFEIFAEMLPIPIYWLNRDGVILGANDLALNAVGMSRQAYVGKNICKIYPFEIANHIKNHNEIVTEKAEILSQEEFVKIVSTNQIRHFNVVKAPLYDANKNIIGVIANLTDITAEKEQRRLKKQAKILEYLDIVASSLPAPIYWLDLDSVVLGGNEALFMGTGGLSRKAYIGKTARDLYPKEIAEHIIEHNEQVMKTGKVMSQEEMIVDITTGEPKYFTAIKAPLRDHDGNVIGLTGTLREAANGIGNIANHLLNQYQKKELDLETGERQPILMSATLMQLLTDKKYQYKNLSVKFRYDATQESCFSFIKAEPTAFKRMISNLINNAVDAFDNQAGEVVLKLKADNEWVKVMIEDSGKGMPKNIVDKIMNNIAITAGKKSGHGIGLTQVCETLQRNQGELTISSALGKGTQMTLTFPRASTPHWIAEGIIIGKQDIIVILDDDTSIHGAWASHFETVLKKEPSIQLKHFTIGHEALQFIQDLPFEEKNKIFLLTDYELLKQEFNGLHIIAKSGIKRSILVTSHYADQLVRDQAAKTGTKILPKQLASEIIITVDQTIHYQNQEQNLRNVDLVIVDDDEGFVKSLTLFVFTNEQVDQYHDPHHFLANISQYSKDTPIYLDNNFYIGGLTGIEIAKQLHEKNYLHLYILSGEIFEPGDIPSYVTVIRKDDIDGIKNAYKIFKSYS